MRIFLLLLLTLTTSKVFAYANFIGHNYTSCLNCHYNPFGGGPVNDYGRAVSATLISSRALYPESMSDEKLAYMSGFLFKKPKQEWLRAQVNYRGFRLVRNAFEEGEKGEWINMQLDGRIILKFGENDKFIGVFNYGYSPLPATQRNTDNQSSFRSREHYLGYRFTPKIGVYAGLMDKVYGIRIIEHESPSRRYPLINQNDQVHGIAGHYLGETWEGGLHVFAGNLIQDEDLRMKGASATFEKTIFDLHRVGASYMQQKNNYQTLTSYALHGRFNFKDGAALLSEVGQSSRATGNPNNDSTSRYGHLQTYLRPFRGLYVLSNVQYSAPDVNEDGYSISWGPGIQYFPLQRLELRLDILNNRNFDTDISVKDSWMYLLQTHLWF